MAYITTERVKEIRSEIKAAFPSFKVSVTKENHSGVAIAILEAPVLLSQTGYEQVNHYAIGREEKTDRSEVLSKITAIANNGVRYHETGDYGTQPSHYVWLSIGQWDKPFKYIVTDENKKPQIGIKIKSTK
jgi:hypothetical protein